MRSIGRFSKDALLAAGRVDGPSAFIAEREPFFAKGACSARGADGTYALPAPNKSFDLMGQLAHNSLPFALAGQGGARARARKNAGARPAFVSM
jgi:hypothetical protein